MRLFGFLGVPSCPFLGPTAELLRADATYSRTCPGVISLIEFCRQIVYACVDAQALDSLWVTLCGLVTEDLYSLFLNRIPPRPLILYPHPSAPSRLAAGIRSSAFGVPETVYDVCRAPSHVGTPEHPLYSQITFLSPGNEAAGIAEEREMDNAGSSKSSSLLFVFTLTVLQLRSRHRSFSLAANAHAFPPSPLPNITRLLLVSLSSTHPTSTFSLQSRFTNAPSLFSPSCWRMQRSSRQLMVARHRRRAMVAHRQAYVDVQPVRSKGATAASFRAQDVQSGTISSPRAHPRPHSSRLRRPTSLRITEDRAEKAVG
ncbi:hypothetical protein B0H13DRAFT_2340376 [Mycena leptocephala]|nr:hypothetical protein B0H13DRAFT_2340376 [Mycena leptocephala]